MIKVQDIIGHGPRNADAAQVQTVVDLIKGSSELQTNFFLNFQGLAAELLVQSKQGRGTATQDFRETCAWQAANINRFVAAVKKKLGAT
jgi:hypothetical protein